MPVKPIPDGYHTVTPYLIVKGAAQRHRVLQEGVRRHRDFPLPGPDGKIGHAEIKIGDSPIMLADEYPADGARRSPKSLGGSPVGIMLYVEDVDATASQAVAAGAKVVRPVKDQFYGDRSGTLADPFGHMWTIATHKEDVSLEEMNRRLQEMMSQGTSA